MCRIRNNEEFTPIKKEVTTIKYGETVTVVVEDSVEGNIFFNIRMIRNDGKESCTQYLVPDDSTCIINIINPPKDKNVIPEEPIEIGTYKKTYRLYFDYKLKMDSDHVGKRELCVEFGTKNE